MLDRLFTLLFLVYFVVTSLVCSVIAAVVRLINQPFDRRLRLLHRFSTFWAWLYVVVVPGWKLNVQGREHIDPKAAYVIVSNHQSLVDILAGYMIRAHFKWVAKAELFRVPFVGWNMILNRHVKIKRGDRQSIVDMMRDAGKHLAQGSSVYLFPEGTRSETGALQTFKTGAFALAKRAQVPILPVAISGSKDALPKGRLVLGGTHRIEVRILAPIPYAAFADEEPKITAERVRERIREALQNLA
jgi:1-acyl-sn-glycerol-3-phosphate acyltransferase